MSQVPTPRPSASVIVVRDGDHGLETFMVRRHARSSVAPSAYVFPGGTVRPDDAEPLGANADQLARLLSERSDTPVAPAEAAGVYASAVRELFEEAGVLLACDASGRLLAIDEDDQPLQERLAARRLALQARQLSLAAVLAEGGWRAAFDHLVPFSHWVTPSALATRFDTWFFVAEMPERQAALHCTIETSEGVWLPPRELLDGSYPIVFATEHHLRRLAELGRVEELLAFARRKPIRRVQPEVVEDSSGLRARLPAGVAEAW